MIYVYLSDPLEDKDPDRLCKHGDMIYKRIDGYYCLVDETVSPHLVDGIVPYNTIQLCVKVDGMLVSFGEWER